jgi:2-polyprenyl-3-methyl-5-hydroxy-6-metoxy-1,4-benzoquinol methylase
MPLVVDRHLWLEGLARAVDGEVAHVGCADSPYTAELLAAGALLHQRLVRVARVTGVDVDVEALAMLRAAMPGERFVSLDVTAGALGEDGGRFGLVIAGEVLEHVPDADSFLRGCRALLAPGGRLCVTVPNACCPKIGLRSLFGRESVHPDHRVYYGPRTLTRTLAGAGFAVESMSSCFPPGAGLGGRFVLNPLLRVAHRLAQGPVGDGLIAVASAAANADSIAS